MTLSGEDACLSNLVLSGQGGTTLSNAEVLDCSTISYVGNTDVNGCTDSDAICDCLETVEPFYSHAISGNGTGADRLYNISNLSTDDFTRECQISCCEGEGDGPSGECGAIVINYNDPDTKLSPDYCVFKLADSSPYSNSAKDAYLISLSLIHI